MRDIQRSKYVVWRRHLRPLRRFINFYDLVYFIIRGFQYRKTPEELNTALVMGTAITLFYSGQKQKNLEINLMEDGCKIIISGNKKEVGLVLSRKV